MTLENQVPRISVARTWELVHSLEADLREFCESYVLAFLDDAVALGDDYARAVELQSADASRPDRDYSVPSITSYLNMNSEIEALNRNSGLLPPRFALELSKINSYVGLLIAIRNAVSHGRPLSSSQIEGFMTFLNSLEMKLFPNLGVAYSQQLSNADYEPNLLETPMKGNSKSSLNNLPRAEFEDTGLVGRDVEVQKVMDLITTGRDQIVSIVGEGGLGKTAIALEVGHRLAESGSFDLIVWSSLKEEKLTATGLTEIHNAVQGIYGVEGVIEQFVLETFNEAVETLAESLLGLRVLLVIDNIETVSGNEIIELYDKLSGSVQFLLTSRVGLGQLERRFELKRLSEKAGRHLFRVLVRYRNVTQLAQLTDEEVDDVLSKLRYSPLAIRWFVMSIEAGRTIKDVLSHQDDLLSFCVGNVVDALSEQATRLLALLHYLKRPLSFEYVAVFGESILSADDIRRAIQELINSSMIVIERNDEGSLSEQFRCTPTVAAYLDLYPIEVANQEEIAQRDRQFRQDEEKRKNR